MNDYVKLFLDSAESCGDAAAVVDRNGTRMTDYSTIRDLAVRTASWIYAKELDERSFIPVCLDSSAEYAAAVFGIWLSGHVAVPMGTSFPQERIRYISTNCDAPFIIDEAAIDEIMGTEHADISLFPDTSDDEAAFLIYTSGSTGMPKGILHSFMGLLANRAVGDPASYSAGQQWALGAPMYFVASVLSYKILTYGGCVHLISSETMHDVAKLEDYYEKNGITFGFISPSVLANFHSRSDALRAVMTGSERLTGQCSREGYKLFNHYGMSETMGTICSFLVDRPYEETPVGIPKAGTEWTILDEDGNDVSEGEEGELCVKGPFTMGYFKDPEATAKLFRGGWLHTGDIMRKLPDGNLVYINRKDWMVKINGQRVEPGEIENRMMDIDGIDMAVVKAVKGAGGRIVLCAYYTGEKTEDSFIREKLSEKLPAYMIPAFYTHMDRFPLNQNGKIDRKNLPEPDIMTKRAEYAPPENETEAVLCRAFEKVLGAECVGIDDDFFDMGGSSISVMTLAVSCPELDLTSKIIYSAKTPRAIAAECVKRGTVRERVIKQEYPLSSSQLGIYIESVNRDGEAAYNNPILLQLGDGIDTERLCHACEAVVEAHPFIKLKLKTDENGDPVQVRNDDAPYSQTVERMSESEFRALLPGLMQPFRLLSDRLFRIRIFETDEGRHIFMDMHHIIFDGSSMLIIMKDLEKAYRGEKLEKETYSGFEAAEDEAERRKTDYGSAEKWYLDTFGGTETDSMPIPDRHEDITAFGVRERELAIDTSEAEDLCRRYGVTENIYTTAAFGVCIGLYAGMNEALFTTIYNGRDSLRTAGTVAMLVKTLPVYSRFDKDTDIREYLSAQKEQMLGCMNNDIYPFADLAAKTGITSGLMFVYQGDLLDVGGFAGEPVRCIPLMDNATGEQFAVQMYKKGGVYSIRVEYRSDLYSAEFVDIFVNSFENVLARMLSAEKIGEISLAGYKELETLREWNRKETDYDRSQTVVSLFRRAAERYPDNTAVIFGDTSLTYAEVDRRSDSIAAYIESRGIGRGDVVSVLIPKGIYQVTASLGALKAGCAYQPLDPTYPPERLNFMVKDASARMLITAPELADIITEFEGERLSADDTDRLPEEKPVNVCSPEDTFILLYTSGSTGVPKGVKLTHANLVCFINWYRKFYELTESDRVSQYASYGFDACMMDMYPALCSGAAVVIVAEDMRLDLNRLNEYYIKNRVTLSFMTTQVGRQFAAEMDNPYLRAVSVGGEKLASMDPPKGFKLYNGYGPTECTIFSTIEQVTKKEDNIPIGRPLDNMKAYVVDPFGHRVPPGALGELILAGPQIGGGYLNRPDKTAEMFINDPFDGGEFSSAYKTGDIVRFRTDGKIEFIGRRDGQVKIHGFRIELSEIETVIREYSGVKNVAVVARDLGADGKAVAAYFVSDEKIDPKAIADFIRDRKPPYMVPASIMQIDSIPLNQNGKVNRKALPEPVMTASEEDNGHTDNILEAELRKMIGSAVNMDRPPLNTPLEYLGFNSLSMIRLSTGMSKRFGVNIPVKGMKDITIAGIEDLIIRGWMNGSKAENITEEAASAELSAAQTGVYIECMKSPDSTVYNIPSELTFDGGMDTDRLVKAVERVIMAHPSLFVHFDIVDDKVMAVRDEVSAPDIKVTELTEDKYEFYRSRSVAPFRLDKAPLFRFSVVRTEKAVRLLCDLHHLIFDGFSMSLFLRDLETALKTDSAPEAESASYFTYAREQKALFAGEAGEEYERYFRGLLENFESPTKLTGDVSGREKGRKCFAYTEYDEARVKRACIRTGVTEAALMLASLDCTLARMTASDRVYISTISSGRADTRFADTYGMFVNTVPLAAELSHGSTDDFVREVAKGFDSAIEHENYPFANIAAKWGYGINIMYEYQRGILEKQDIPHLTGIQSLAQAETKFGLAVRIIDRDGRAQIEAEYNDGVYSEGFIKEFLRSYVIVTDKFSRRGDEKLRGISLLDAGREAVLNGFRKRPVDPDIPGDVLFHSGMERFAAEIPDKTAIIAADGTYTYRQLNENANRVANALIARGVKKGDRVVLLLPRTALMFFSLFGVLKAGAAYIPCDPNYPVERIKHIIDDSGASLVMTTADRLGRFTDRPAADAEVLLTEQNTSKPDVKISQDDLAYLIYTSGSTGKPKGVMLRHRGAVNYVTNTPGNILVNGMTERGHVLTAITTFSFDFSVKEWAAPLFNGLTLSVAADDEINDAAKLAERMKRTDTDVFGSTPSRLLMLLASPEFSAAFENCKVVICGGEKYPEQLLAALKKTDRLIFNTYGPTEITVSSNTAELSAQDLVNTGRPLPGVVEYIVDSDGNELPAGLVGELYIGGVGVAAGYNGLPEMTAERFIEYGGGRVYKSGDFARWTPEGYVEILGRKDNQIKLRGLRIELDEVDAVLGAVEGISRTAVKIEKINGIEHLCAWFTADHKVDIGELRKELGRTLTNYMVPTAYMQLDEMPMTPNGKLDLRSLPLPELYRGDRGGAASTKTEQIFCDIFSKVLHVDNVGAAENFFDLGGTSLLVTNIVIEAGKYGIRIAFSDVFDNPTPKALAALSGDKGEAVPSEDSGITDYDYTAIEEILARNTLDSFRSGECRSLGNVLLTGAVGYLGIHILHELIDNSDGKIYCLLRSHRDTAAQMRLPRMYYYYFDTHISDLIGDRLIIVDGDVTDPAVLASLDGEHIDTVINCAAVVKHFAADTVIEDVNVGGAQNLIDFCLRTGAALVQTSTMSVLNEAYEDDIPEGFEPSEQTLYMGQLLTNKYVRSKFLAERAVLEAIADKGLRGKIVRLGNLAARYSDGEFQINSGTNSSMGRLRAYAMLGCASYDILDSTMEFSPIDAVARAIVLLSGTPDDCTVFHAFNNQKIMMENVFRELTALGYTIRYAEADEFAKAFAQAQNDPDKASMLTSIMAYMPSSGERRSIRLPRKCEYTMQVLYRLGFSWPVTTWDYIGRFVSALSGLGFFDDTED
ncbi:MAG: amino acid adenylation domain-containing protein [Oscillospiraceae bacterium]|nr:amino acid adenylation domain-containing protein [Oscillospiraceae bacterium]